MVQDDPDLKKKTLSLSKGIFAAKTNAEQSKNCSA